MEKYVLYFNEIDQFDLPSVGGKGANLGEMTKAGFPVPQGFCISTEAYRAFIQTSGIIDSLFDQLEQLKHDDLEQIRTVGKQIREHLAQISMPDEIKSAILEGIDTTGKDKAYAVRSSATAEDLPDASFAGQQDTFLNVCGKDQLLEAVKQCWSSLFTDRAISYRAKNGFDNRSVFLAVVVQEMVFPEVSGIMFTADPITGHRKTVSIDASFGLGEALVSGVVSADLYQIRSGEIVKKQLSKKESAIYSVPEGGTVQKTLSPEKQQTQALPDPRIIELAELGRKIEAHYGKEQDIEWAFAGGRFYILQSRPITSLYPVVRFFDDRPHVLINFGYIQMMTDPLKPLGVSVISQVLRFLKKDPSAQPILREAGGRVFADITGALSLKFVRSRLLKVLSGMDQLMASAVSEVVKRKEHQLYSTSRKGIFHIAGNLAPILIPAALKVAGILLMRNPDKAEKKAELIIEAIVTDTEEQLSRTSGAETIRVIQKGMGNMLQDVLSKVAVYVLSGMIAAGLLEKKLKKKLGDEKSAILLGKLYKSLPHNVTTEMGLELGDLSDQARKYPAVIDYFKRANSENFMEELLKIPGGAEMKRSLDDFLKKYGMRCVGEIDLTRPRWAEAPVQLVPSILSHIRTIAAGEHRRKFKQGETEAEEAKKEIISQFRFPEKKRVSRLVHMYRSLMGMREHHKFTLVKLMFLYKKAILKEARTLVGKGILNCEEDVFYFTLEELIALLENRGIGDIPELLADRKRQHTSNQKLTSPRVMTSKGEIITGKLRNEKSPEGALTGTPVSAGIIEGTARVAKSPEDAKLNQGDILVAPYTDPGWTPLFTSAVGLITEVGGMMTHGSVVAREYGIPAVVGIDKATEIIEDGAYIRVDGTNGFVQILDGNGS
ncbi:MULTISPECIES: phosphoenolpyruvate synthase [Bacillus]|nr:MULTISPECIES: phosphoenolpyruvate synthase [Bacillus]ARC68251.1 phosphoenolpyruvate synthase [Bacillus licheniformis]MBU8561836.1 phosphoenolpyruvate synthase [Bacillus licheniformis]MBY8832671.1 phosphoenolpyruvate synthase [Bacillus licheniformis]MDE1364282.1 phosphoenolpyruvate synthase [Bacillus licheniformis]MDE1432416.1 phosphoenolpyruvate synthase [Bacillus licheniformis]